jgi:hypothetical protein
MAILAENGIDIESHVTTLLCCYGTAFYTALTGKA